MIHIDGKPIFLVQFDKGGKLYTYHKTEEEFTVEMAERVKDYPHKIWAVTELQEGKMK